MPDDNPIDFIRDLVIYAPTGAIAIARERVEEFLNEAIERGKVDRDERQTGLRNQLAIAKSVGKARVEQAVKGLDDRSSEAPFRAVRDVGDTVVKQAQKTADVVVSQSLGQDVIRQAQEQMGIRLAKSRRAGNGGRPPTGDSGHLAIEDYESLSAAQINARLGGLERAELEALREYEVSHRARTTVISRVDQALDGQD